MSIDTNPYALAGRYVRDGHSLDDAAGRFGLDPDELRAYLDKPLGNGVVEELAEAVTANAYPVGRGKSLAQMTPDDLRYCPHGAVQPPGRWPDCEVCLASARYVGLLPATQEERDEAEEILREAGMFGGEAAQAAAEAGVNERYDDLYLPRSALANLPQGEPLIEDVLDRHSLFVVAGRDQTFKSFLVLGWLCCLATGTPWLGRPVKHTKVLYVVGEGAYGLDARISAWETAWRAEVDDEWFHVRRAPVNLFRHGAALADLLARITVEGYGVVVFDTLQRMASGADQNSARDAGVIVETLDAVRRATGGAAGVVAHTDKGDNDTRGSSAFEDDADIVWRTKRDEDEQTIRVTLAKRKDGPAGLTIDLIPEQVPGTGSLVLGRGTAALPGSDRPPAQAFPALRALAAKSAPTSGLSASALQDALGLSGKGGLYRALDWLMDAGYVRKVEVGRWPSYMITNEGRSHLTETLAEQE